MISALEKALEEGLLCTHPITGDIFKAIYSYSGYIEVRFIKDFIAKVDERVKRIEQFIDKEYLQNDEFNNFLYKTIFLATRDVRKEKLNLFANIIVNSVLKGNANENEGYKYLYDETIDKIDENLFRFLLKMSSRVLCDSESESKGWCGDSSELETLNVDSMTFKLYADYLLSVGVVVRLPKLELNAETGHLSYHEEYYVTEYGKKFVDYVREQ